MVINNQGFLTDADDYENMNGVFDNILAQVKDKASTAVENAGQKFIDKNQAKITSLAQDQGAYILDKYFTRDKNKLAASKARLSSVIASSGQEAGQQASMQIKQLVMDNKWLIVGGIIGVVALMGGVLYTASSVAARKARA